MAHIIGLDLLDDALRAIVHAGDYRSKEEAIAHALEVLLAANPALRLNTAVELYRQGLVTLSRADEPSCWLRAHAQKRAGYRRHSTGHLSLYAAEGWRPGGTLAEPVLKEQPLVGEKSRVGH